MTVVAVRVARYRARYPTVSRRERMGHPEKMGPVVGLGDEAVAGEGEGPERGGGGRAGDGDVARLSRL